MALMWFLAVPQFLLRDEVRVAEKEEARQNRRRRNRGEQDPEQQREAVLQKLAKGQVSRAMGLIKSNGVANMEEPGTQAALRAKFPPRRRELPATVPRAHCVDSLVGLRINAEPKA